MIGPAEGVILDRDEIPQRTYVIPKARSAFFEKLNNARLDGFQCDAFFQVGNEKKVFSAHRLVLAISSKVFQASYYGSFVSKDGESASNPTIVSDVCASAFALMLDFIYSSQSIDSIPIDDHIVVHLLYAAEKYDLGTLKHACLRKLTEMELSNVAIILGQALDYDEAFLIDASCSLIDSNPDAFIHSSQFLKCELKTLMAIVGRNDFKPFSEMSLFEKLMDWSAAECGRQGREVSPNARRELLGDALTLVRFPLMNLSELQQVARVGILTKEELADLFLYAADNANKPGDFVTSERTGVKSHSPRRFQICVPIYCSVVRRFTDIEEIDYKYNTFTIFFKADQKITLIGFGIFEFCDASSAINEEDFRVDFGAFANWQNDSKRLELSSVKSTDEKVIQVILRETYKLEEDKEYVLRVEIKGSEGRRRYRGLWNDDTASSTVRFERHRNVKFSFDKFDSTHNRFFNEIYFIV